MPLPTTIVDGLFEALSWVMLLGSLSIVPVAVISSAYEYSPRWIRLSCWLVSASGLFLAASGIWDPLFGHDPIWKACEEILVFVVVGFALGLALAVVISGDIRYAGDEPKK